MVAPTPRVYDLHPPISDFRADVIAGLSSERPYIAPKYFYDDRGSELFSRICETSEYYLTRTEVALLKSTIDEVAASVGEETLVLELGVGLSDKVEILLAALQRPALYAGVEINRSALEEALEKLRGLRPGLPLAGIVADFTRPWSLPKELEAQGAGRLCFLPGSTVGNFTPPERELLLGSIRELLGEGGQLLIGADLVKERRIIERAYNDGAGITADFNRNLLYRMRRELDVEVEPDTFRHHAFYNDEERRIEMHLVAESQQQIRLGDRVFHFESGDSIHTESSYKFRVEEWREMARSGGFSSFRHWTDSENWFALFLLTV